MNIIHPGWVRSRNDGDKHYITYNDLVRLYRLDPRECISADKSRDYKLSDTDRHFFPDSTGRYGNIDESQQAPTAEISTAQQES